MAFLFSKNYVLYPKLSRKELKIPCFFFHNQPEDPVHRFSPLWHPGGIETAFFLKNNTFFRPPKGGDTMAVFRIEKIRDYTVMSNLTCATRGCP